MISLKWCLRNPVRAIQTDRVTARYQKDTKSNVHGAEKDENGRVTFLTRLISVLEHRHTTALHKQFKGTRTSERKAAKDGSCFEKTTKVQGFLKESWGRLGRISIKRDRSETRPQPTYPTPAPCFLLFSLFFSLPAPWSREYTR